VPERPSKLDPFVERLTAWFRREMGRSRKQKRTIKQLYADLVSLTEHCENRSTRSLRHALPPNTSMSPWPFGARDGRHNPSRLS
jgi:hypothetical protein